MCMWCVGVRVGGMGGTLKHFWTSLNYSRSGWILPRSKIKKNNAARAWIKEAGRILPCSETLSITPG